MAETRSPQGGVRGVRNNSVLSKFSISFGPSFLPSNFFPESRNHYSPRLVEVPTRFYWRFTNDIDALQATVKSAGSTIVVLVELQAEEVAHRQRLASPGVGAVLVAVGPTQQNPC